jgi:hypothetical protein
MTRAFFVAFAVLAAMLVFAPSRSEARDKPDQVRVVYAKPKNPAHEKLREELKKTKALEKMREFLSPLRLPRKLTLRLEGCDGELNAWYDDDVVSVCYDYIAFIMDNAAKVPEKLRLSRKAALVGASLDLVLHEVGHAVFDMLEIPLFGREEDAADMFSAYIMLRFTPADAHKLITATAYLAATEARRDQKPKPSLKDYANEHELPAQRYFNLLCIAYGSNAKIFADALSVGKLPKDRAEGCEDEYEQTKYAFETLIKPHLDQRLLKKVRAKKWFDFEDAARPGGQGARITPR